MRYFMVLATLFSLLLAGCGKAKPAATTTEHKVMKPVASAESKPTTSSKLESKKAPAEVAPTPAKSNAGEKKEAKKG